MREYTFSKILGANFDWVPISTFGDSDIEASYFGDTATESHNQKSRSDAPTRHIDCIEIKEDQRAARLTQRSISP